MRVVYCTFFTFCLLVTSISHSQLVDSVWVNRVEGQPGELVSMEVWLQWPRDSLESYEIHLTWDATICTVEAVNVNAPSGYLTASNVDNSVPLAQMGAAHMFGPYIGSGDHLGATVDFRIISTATPPCSTYVDTTDAPMLRDQHGAIFYAAYGGNYVVVPRTTLGHVWVDGAEGLPGELVSVDAWLDWPKDSLGLFEMRFTWNAAICTVEVVNVYAPGGYMTASDVDNTVPYVALGAVRLFGDYIGSGDHLAATVEFRILETTTPPCSTYIDTVFASMLRDQFSNMYYATYDGDYLAVFGQFIRADANIDSTVEMSDAIFTLQALYVPGSDTLECKDAGDSDDNGSIEMSDAIYTLKYLYVPGAPEPPAPFPDCGVDATQDGLGCGAHPCMQ